MDAEGLFRIPGSLQVVKQYKRRFDSGEYDVAIAQDENVENVASIVIRFLNDLDPKMNKQTDLFSSDSKSWLHAANHLTKGAKRGEKVTEAQVLERVKGLLLQLEPSGAEVFRRIACVLNKASDPAHAKNNMMTPKKFSLCTFPQIMGFVEKLIVEYDNIFPLVYDEESVNKFHNGSKRFVGVTLQ